MYTYNKHRGIEMSITVDTLFLCQSKLDNPIFVKICGVTGTQSEASDIAQGVIDTDETADAIVIQRIGTWVPCTTSARVIGDGKTVASKTNDEPERGRCGSVCDIKNRKSNNSVVGDNNAAMVGNTNSSTFLGGGTKPPPQHVAGVYDEEEDEDERDHRTQLLLHRGEDDVLAEYNKLQENLRVSLEKARIIRDSLDKMEGENESFSNDYRYLYLQSLRESGMLDKLDQDNPDTIVYYVINSELPTHHTCY